MEGLSAFAISKRALILFSVSPQYRALMSELRTVMNVVEGVFAAMHTASSVFPKEVCSITVYSTPLSISNLFVCLKFEICLENCLENLGFMLLIF